MNSNINIECDFEAEDYMDNQTIQISFNASEGSSFYQETSQLRKQESVKPAIQGIPKSSFSFETESINDSFSDISGSFSDLMVSQTDPALENNSVGTVQTKDTRGPSPSKQIQATSFVKPTSKKQVIHQKHQSDQQQSEKYSQEYSLESYNIYQKSFYMQPYEPHTQSPPSKSALKTERSEVAVIFRVTSYFLQVDQLSVLIDGESLKNLYDQFFNKQIFVPLFNYQRYENWVTNSDQDKYSLDFQPHKNFKVYLQRYVAYLNERYPKEFLTILKTLFELQNKKCARKVESRSFLSFGLNVGWIIDYVKELMVIHKTETLRKTLLNKINSMRVALVYCLGANCFAYQMEYLKEAIQKAWLDLSNIQLLLSFQTTEQFCSKKIESSPEAKFKEIWTKYREDIRSNKAKFVKQHLEELII